MTERRHASRISWVERPASLIGREETSDCQNVFASAIKFSHGQMLFAGTLCRHLFGEQKHVTLNPGVRP